MQIKVSKSVETIRGYTTPAHVITTVLLEMRRPQDALDLLKAGLLVAAQGGEQSERPDPFEIRYRLSIAYQMASQAQEAIQELEAVLQAQPAHAGAHVHLGSLYYQSRQFEPVWRHARRAQTLAVPVAELIAALRRVSVEPR